MPLEEEYLEQNHAPTYLQNQVSPNPSRVVIYQPDVDPRVFPFEVGGIDDPNPEDRFYYRVFLNYLGQQEKRYMIEGPRAGRPPETRSQGIDFGIDICQYLNSSSIQRVDLLVTDRPFVDSEDEAEDEISPNQVLPEDAGAFRITWFIDASKCAL